MSGGLHFCSQKKKKRPTHLHNRPFHHETVYEKIELCAQFQANKLVPSELIFEDLAIR